MKKFYLLLSLLIICVSSLFAQAPEKFTYQAVVRNASNQLVINAQVGVRVNILQGSATGNAVYSESHVTSSNANGLITVNIGGGSVLHGSFTGIDWSDGPYFLKTDIDPNGGNDYTITSTQQLLSVPYALYAKEAANSFSGDYNDLTNTPQIPTVPDNVSAFTNDAGYITAEQVPAQVNADWNATSGAAEILNKPAIPTVPTNVSAFTNDAGYITAAQCGDVDICAMANQLAQLQQQMSQMQARLDSLEGNTTFTCGTSTVTDHEGNVYHTVQIGNQCWMRDNLRTTTSPSTGTYLIPAAGTGYTYTGKQARWYNNDSATYAPMNYGLLYNWNAAVDTFNTTYGETSVNTNDSNAVSVTFNGHRRGICPAGWHLPSDAEWTQLTDYVSSQSEYTCSGNSNNIAKALASTEGWNPSTNNCAVGNDPSTNNATGFSAVPAGDCRGSSFGFAGSYANFWSSTQDNGGFAYSRGLIYASAGVYRYLNDGKYNGFSVRCLRDETSGGGGTAATLPTVTTGSVNEVTAMSASCGGNISSDGGASVTARGICWSTSQNPTVNGSHTADGSGMGSFSSSISGLTANTTYYVRAYATNSVGTAYGNEVSFTTLSTAVIDSKSCPAAPTVTDHEGNVYATVQIGNQCWTRDNLRTTTSPTTGTYLIPAAGTGYTYTGKQAFWYNNDLATYAPMNYGLLYNWNAAVDTFNTTYGETSVNTSSSNAVSVTFNGHRRGICPAGWHLPSDAEWTQLTNYVSSQSEYTCDSNSNYIAKALASTEGWNTYTNNCVVGNDPSTNNATGFSAVPAGGCYGSSFDAAGYGADFWSSTQSFSNLAWARGLYYYRATVDRYDGSDESNGFSVRCLRDETSGGGGTAATLPTVTTGSVNEVTAMSASCGGNISSDGGASVTARGICWSTSQNPTVSNSHTTDGSGTGSFTSSITGLTANTTYYVRAYATNSVGTAYGEEVTFTTFSAGGTAVIDSKSCPGTPTVTDHEGNVYATVQIGNQCWMRDNLRTTTSPSTGTYLIPAAGTGYTFTGKQAFWYNNDSATYAPMNYGLLYNWNAAVDTFNTTYGETSVNTNDSNAVSVTFNGHRRGICPAGWHLPSDAEWNTMEATVSGSDWQTSYETFTGYRGNHAGKLAGGDNWSSGTTSGAPGDYGNADRNVSGFSAVPAGFRSGSSFFGAFYGANFWSSTQYDSYDAQYRSLYYSDALVFRGGYIKFDGMSVRCLRD